MKPQKPAKPCVRCGRLTENRRDGRACPRCWGRLTELKDNKNIRALGKLKDSRGW